jgi:hypothetical protein
LVDTTSLCHKIITALVFSPTKYKTCCQYARDHHQKFHKLEKPNVISRRSPPIEY